MIVYILILFNSKIKYSTIIVINKNMYREMMKIK